MTSSPNVANTDNPNPLPDPGQDVSADEFARFKKWQESQAGIDAAAAEVPANPTVKSKSGVTVTLVNGKLVAVEADGSQVEIDGDETVFDAVNAVVVLLNL